MNTLPTDYLAPQAPNDDLTFDQLAASYNFQNTSDRRRVFVRLIQKQAAQRPRPVRALDIGCGTGISEDPAVNVTLLQGVRAAVDDLWGVEPDPSITPAHTHFDHFQHALFEDAEIPDNSIDIAYSYFVMEHVADPLRFMQRLHRCLKPGGVYLFITPNARHYFTRIAGACNKLKIDETVLRWARGSKIDTYHYPVCYRFNHPRRIDKIAAQAGFLPPQYAYTESGGVSCYFPGPTKIIHHLLTAKRKLWRQPHSLLEMICQIQKPLL